MFRGIMADKFMVLFQFDQKKRKFFIKQLVDEFIKQKPGGEMFEAWVFITRNRDFAHKMAQLAGKYGGWGEVYEVSEK